MRLLGKFTDRLPAELNEQQHAEATPEVRRKQVTALRQHLANVDDADARQLLTDADALVEKNLSG